MDNNTNEILGIGDKETSKDKETSNIDLEVFDYSSYRDSFWQKRYPATRVLYKLSKLLGWIIIIVSVLFLLEISSGNGLLKELGIVFLLAGVFAGIAMLFISEIILFQVDKNFFSYLDIHNKLEQLRDKK